VHIDIDDLRRRFAGKKIKVTRTGNDSSVTGTCCAVHPKDEGTVEFELTRGDRFGFVPDVLTDNSVEGEYGRTGSGRRRKVELV
jgi:hypothetical protein